MEAKEMEIDPADLTTAIDRIKSNKIPEETAVEPAKRPVGRPTKITEMQKIINLDVQEDNSQNIETGSSGAKMGSSETKITSKRAPKIPQINITDITQLAMPEGVFPAPVKLIRT
jgi:hypothetical protein